MTIPNEYLIYDNRPFKDKDRDKYKMVYENKPEKIDDDKGFKLPDELLIEHLD